MEFPIYNAIVAFVWKLAGTTEAVYARLTTVVITLFSTLFLYLLVRKFSGWQTAAISAFFFAAIPYSVFYSSTILPGPFMVFATLGLYYSFVRWLEKENNVFWLASSIVFANLAILSWPIALFFTLPLLYLVWDKYGFNFLANRRLWIFALLSILPFAAWRIWMLKFPEGIPSYQFLLNEGNIRFKGAFFRWLVAQRMGQLILTVGGFALFILGLIKKPQSKEKFFYYFWLASAALYFTVFASGNVRHDYYQVPFFPIASVFMAIGVKTLMFPSRDLVSKWLTRTVLAALVAFTFAFGYFEVRGYWWINKPEIVEAGKAADRLLPKDATVVAPYIGDDAFLYQTNRRGYPITDRPLEKFIDQGTKYLVSVDVNDPGIKNLAEDCKVVEKTDRYVIVEMFRECIGK